MQYGQKLTLQTEYVVKNMHTSKSYVEYVESTDHGSVVAIDGEIQLSSQDEYRYHETLVHPVMKKVTDGGVLMNLSVLILGGGDGCAAREVYKWGNVSKVTIVDYDTDFVNEFGRKWLQHLNKEVFTRNTIEHVCQDAAWYIENTQHKYDVIIIDLPDPHGQYMITVYEKILKGCSRILNYGGGIGMHVGPALLNEYNLQWHTITKFKDMLLHSFNSRKPDISFSTCYVPSFSNEWAFLHLSVDKYIEGNEQVYTRQVTKLCKFWIPNTNTTPSDIMDIYIRRV